MSDSLFTKLKYLESAGSVSVVREPGRHKVGEGRYCFGGEPIQFLANQVRLPAGYTGEADFTKAQDLALCAKTKTLIASAQSDTFEEVEDESADDDGQVV